MEILILLLVITAISYFTFSPSFSPIPFFPTDTKDLPHIIKGLHLKNDMIVFDLGAGTGTVIFAAAAEAKEKGLNTKFVAIDINHILYTIMKIKKLFHPNAENIEIIRGDLFRYNYAEKSKQFKNLSYYMYVSPWFTNPMAQLIKDNAQHADVISYYYPVTTLPQKEHIEGTHDIYVYEVK